MRIRSKQKRRFKCHTSFSIFEYEIFSHSRAHLRAHCRVFIYIIYFFFFFLFDSVALDQTQIDREHWFRWLHAHNAHRFRLHSVPVRAVWEICLGGQVQRPVLRSLWCFCSFIRFSRPFVAKLMRSNCVTSTSRIQTKIALMRLLSTFCYVTCTQTPSNDTITSTIVIATEEVSYFCHSHTRRIVKCTSIMATDEPINNHRASLIEQYSPSLILECSEWLPIPVKDPSESHHNLY